ncbi:hypothetical protein ACHAWX_002747 [Stephanocyclus meneghinianus]
MSREQHQRLAAIKRLLQETASEAYTTIVSNNASILGDSTLPPTVQPDHDAEAAAADRAGYETGLALFGTSSTYREQTHREMEETLAAIETEARDLRRAASSAADHPAAEDHRSSPLYCDSTEELQRHVDLLRKCLKVRRWLEEADDLTLSVERGGSSSSQSMLLSSSFSPSNMLFSPSSLCSFRFDAADETRGERNGEQKRQSPMVHAATLIRRIHDAMEDIRQICWKDHSRMDDADVRDNQHNNDDNNNNKEEEEEEEEKRRQMHQMQAEIVKELAHQTRRKTMEWKYRATSYLQACLSIADERKLIIRGSAAAGDDNHSKKVSFRNAHSEKQQRELSTPREADSRHLSTPLSDAYAVLEAFQDARFPVFGETLNRAVEAMGSQLFLQVFRPCLDELDSTVATVGGKASVVVRYYRLKRETFQNASAVAAAGSGGGRSGVDRKYDVMIKGPAFQLEWELCKMKAKSRMFAENDDHSTNILSVAPEIHETQLAASAPTASVATFLSSLHFLTQVLEFVHRHLLLTRTDLASLMGKYLFGTYPVPTSLSSGSAKLGGILVGCAAWGEDSGDTRPLMVHLIRLMRKWCIPLKSNPEVWKLIPRIQRVLMREVEAFERKMLELGFMNVGEAVVNKRSVETSSPSGLSVLLNEDDVASPMDANLTLNTKHCSPIEIVSPSAERSKSNNMVRSSLSELAHAFLQAYSENQRSQILNRGRSILLSTDYHNSVQVGTFVPPPAEPGTLEHLDDDPLNAFLFQQCSISTTAQNTLDLCRKTLDEAIRPEMGQELDALPPMLYRASRELLDLFRAMIPTLHASEIASIPRMAAILHNDCVFLAHEASLLGAEYKRKFPSSTEDSESKTHRLSEICTFVDMVPPFRELATKSMGSMLELQKNQLFELISPRLAAFEQALSSNESVMEWDDAETALRAALYHLRHLSQSWSQVLARDVYHLAIG